MIILDKEWDFKTDTFNLKEIVLKKIEEEGYKIVCNTCGKEHHPISKKFMTIVGNIMVGLRGGIVGNHIKTNGQLVRIQFFCRKKKCFDYLVFDEIYDSVKYPFGEN